MEIFEEAFKAALKAYDAYWENDMDPDEAMRCALRAYLTSAVPVGWQLVPKRPTPEMIGAWYRHKNGVHYHEYPVPEDTSDYGAYRAMIAIAPTLPETLEKDQSNSSDIHTDEEVDDAISALRRVIRAAEHSNHNGECAVIKAAKAIKGRH